MLQGEPVKDRFGTTFFSEKFNDSVNVVYCRYMENLDDICAQGYVKRGSSDYIEFNSEDFRKMRKLVLNSIRGFIGEEAVKRFSDLDVGSSWNSESSAGYLFNSEYGLSDLVESIEDRIGKSDGGAFRKSLKYYTLEYLDKGFDYLRELAKDYANQNTKELKESYIYNMRELNALKDIYDKPASHLNEWCGKAIKNCLDGKKCVECEYTSLEDDSEESVKIIRDLQVEATRGYVSGAIKGGGRVGIPFSRINRLFYSGKCIYDGESERECICSEEFKTGISGMLDVVRGNRNRIGNDLYLCVDSLVYCENSGHFGIIDEDKMLRLDNGRMEKYDVDKNRYVVFSMNEVNNEKLSGIYNLIDEKLKVEKSR